MTDVSQLAADLRRTIYERPYIRRLDWLTVGRFVLKARLYLEPDLHEQVYRNDQFDTTNLVLIHANRRRDISLRCRERSFSKKYQEINKC